MPSITLDTTYVSGVFRIGLAIWHRKVYDIVLAVRIDENDEPSQYQRTGADSMFEIRFFHDVNSMVIELVQVVSSVILYSIISNISKKTTIKCFANIAKMRQLRQLRDNIDGMFQV